MQAEQAAAWKKWIDAHDWDAIETDLVARVDATIRSNSRRPIEALGHIGSEPGKAAMRKYLDQTERAPSPSARRAWTPAWRQSERWGTSATKQPFRCWPASSEENIAETPLRPRHSHEFGWSAPPDFLAGAAAEALGRIGTPAAEDRLLTAYGKLVRFWYYTFRTADHDWLMGCHSSIPHYRIAEALDAIGSRRAADLTGKLLESVPIDTDRGLLHENDAYETVTGRVIQRSGTGPRGRRDTCLAVLGDKEAKSRRQLAASVTASPPAVSVGPLGRESRAAQLLSVVCFRPEDAPQVRAAFERYRAQPPSRERSWTCFFLARTLGKLGDREAVGRAAGGFGRGSDGGEFRHPRSAQRVPAQRDDARLSRGRGRRPGPHRGGRGGPLAAGGAGRIRERDGGPAGGGRCPAGGSPTPRRCPSCRNWPQTTRKSPLGERSAKRVRRSKASNSGRFA